MFQKLETQQLEAGNPKFQLGSRLEGADRKMADEN